MLKARGDLADGKKVAIIGLSRRNAELLLEGKPIKVNLEDIGIQGGPLIVLMGGEIEGDVVRELAGYVSRNDAEVEFKTVEGEALSAEEAFKRR